MKHRIIALFCVAVLLLLLPGCGEKAAEEPNFDGYKIYELTMWEGERYTIYAEEPHAIYAVVIAPHDATRSDVACHTEHTVKALREVFPRLDYVGLTYYESILFYKSGDTPIADTSWEPQGGNKHVVCCTYFSHCDQYALTEEERALYAQLQKYFLEQLGHPLVSWYEFTQEEIEEFERAAKALGHTSKELMDLTTKQFYWRPPDWYD